MQQSRQFAFEREHHDDRARAATEKASFTHRIQRTYTNNIMMMNAFLSSLLLLVSPSQAWLQQRQTSKAFLPNGAVHLILRHADKKGNGNGNGGASVETDDPCWQNMLDDDCSMGNIYSSRFVAADWIKSMPCGEGIEDCDMPTGLSSPETRPEAGVDQVDVVDFLGLKRAESLSKPSKSDKDDDDDDEVSP